MTFELEHPPETSHEDIHKRELEFKKEILRKNLSSPVAPYSKIMADADDS